jgi:FkbM family methyltransferase
VIDPAALEKHAIRRGDVEFDIWSRKDSAADSAVLHQIFVDQDYRFEQWAQGELVRRLYDRVAASGRTPLIVDAGANIGASAAWFGTIFPRARIVAIEPEPGNLELLRMNCARENFDIVAGAVGAEDGTMHLVDPGGGAWAFRVEREGDHPVPVYAIDTLLRRFDAASTFPLLCKIDIEGGEADLFAKNTSWVSRFALVIIELHDWMLPFKGSSNAFLKTIAALDFELTVRGENIFCFNSIFFDQ